MALLSFPLLVLFSSTFLPIWAVIELGSVCQMGDPLVVCPYATPDVYTSLAVDGSVERIQFDRLTESTLDLENLPNVVMVEISSALFETRGPCDTIERNRQPVSVVFGEKSKVCLADHQWQQTETSTSRQPGTSLEERWTATLSAETKLTETTSGSTGELTDQPTDKPTDKPTHKPTDKPSHPDYIIIISCLSAIIILIIIVIVLICLCKSRRRRPSEAHVEMGVRFGQLPRSSEIEETVFFDVARKRE